MEYTQGFYGNINDITETNYYFREVISTTINMQLVVMSINTQIGTEIHPYTTQFIRVESGTGIAIINNISYSLFDDIALIIPPNTEHNIINTGPQPLKIYTIYSPPNHPYNRLDVNNPENESI